MELYKAPSWMAEVIEIPLRIARENNCSK